MDGVTPGGPYVIMNHVDMLWRPDAVQNENKELIVWASDWIYTKMIQNIFIWGQNDMSVTMNANRLKHLVKLHLNKLCLNHFQDKFCS